MRIIIQRVKRAKVETQGLTPVIIGAGLVVLAGIARNDTEQDADYLADKITQVRVFGDPTGKMNHSVIEARGQVLLVPNFTLCGDCRRGRRPDFTLAAPPVRARELFEYLIEAVKSRAGQVETGVFQAHMEVELVNDGPVTLVIDSGQRGRSGAI